MTCCVTAYEVEDGLTLLDGGGGGGGGVTL